MRLKGQLSFWCILFGLIFCSAMSNAQTETKFAFLEGGKVFQWQGFEYGCHVFSAVFPIHNDNDVQEMRERFVSLWKKTLNNANELENGCQPDGITLKGPFVSEARTRQLLREERLNARQHYRNADRMYWIVWFLNL
jgi:Skp family chaperone for outer membrane proteins